MGQARRRGSFEERKALALAREQEKQASIRAKWELRESQESEAWTLMTEEQIDMTHDRFNRVSRRQANHQMQLASLLGMIVGGDWNMFRGRIK